jgi:hypothetical protein
VFTVKPSDHLHLSRAAVSKAVKRGEEIVDESLVENLLRKC